mmetsp:Transcript_39481/g.85944  ORF Transcript_39481/g.85944 Transcript_39481/m.85944 type:complete len:1019 (-) Transcript_39481:309-3365(-)
MNKLDELAGSGVMEDAFVRTAEEVLSHFEVDGNTGLTDEEASRRLLRFGRNEMPPDEGVPFWKLVLKQFDDLLVKILIASAVISFLLAVFDGEGWEGFVEPFVIVLILVANAAVGVITETNAEKAIEELKILQADLATVVRGKRLRVVPAAELVPGDVVEVAVGGKVPSDARLIQIFSSQLRCDQAILTGESDSVLKDLKPCATAQAVYQDKTCMLFSGTVITVGRARAVVAATGGRTAIGRIHSAIVEVSEEMTPLKKKLDEFGTFLAKVIAVICVLVWVVNIGNFRNPAHGGLVRGAIYYFKIAVALAVAAIPEGLPAVVTTCLALGTKKMAKCNAIVRSLPSVETLGCTTVICSDKTGTLTTNMMSVSRVAVLGPATNPSTVLYEVTGNTYAPEGILLEPAGEGGERRPLSRPADNPALLQVAVCASMCNDSNVQYNQEKNTYDKIGESTEVALRVLVEKVGLPGYDSMPTALTRLSKQDRVGYCNSYWEGQYTRLATLEFSRDRKMMSVLCTRKGQETLFVKGAPESVLAVCDRAQSSDGQTVAMTEALRQDVLARAYQLGSEQTLRTMALAVRPMPGTTKHLSVEHERGLTFVGLAAMLDPPREEVRHAVEMCRAAGIRVIVVTGDNKATAEAVCRRIGVLDELDESVGPSKSYSGLEFDKLSDTEKAEAVASMVVFSRVEPSHKSRLVDLLKAGGHVVAMTGDGVNDAPALKRADVGIAVCGATDAARASADIVLTEPGLSTIAAAVVISRKIFTRMKNFVIYRVACTIQLLIFFFVATIVFDPQSYDLSSFFDDTDDEWPSYFTIPTIAMVSIAILNDGTLIAVAYDNVEAGRYPEKWDLKNLYLVATIIGGVAMVSSMLLLDILLDSNNEQGPWQYFGYYRLDYGEIMGMVYLKIALSDYLTLFNARTKGFAWKNMPSPFLLIAACFAMSASTMLAMIWPEADEDEDMEAIGLDKVIFVWLYTLAWSLVQDLAKVLSYQAMEKAGMIATAQTLTAKDVEGLSIVSAYEDL